MAEVRGYVAIFFAYILGAGSLMLFAVFCYAGPLHLIELRLNNKEALFFDAFLSVAFFIQHSGMVRRSFRQYLSRFVPEAYVSSIYTISSGLALLAVILFWQETAGMIGTAKDGLRLLLRAIFALSIVGFYWGTSALGFFDPFGVRSILNHLGGRKAREMPLSIKGPYRFVRHPLYFFVLLVMWSSPDLTYDRLLFNVLWSLWVYIGAVLEERDLSADFGDAYDEYKRKVPMLIPWRLN